MERRYYCPHCHPLLMKAHDDTTRLVPGLSINFYEGYSDGRSAVLGGMTKTGDCNGEDQSGKIGGK